LPIARRIGVRDIPKALPLVGAMPVDVKASGSILLRRHYKWLRGEFGWFLIVRAIACRVKPVRSGRGTQIAKKHFLPFNPPGPMIGGVGTWAPNKQAYLK